MFGVPPPPGVSKEPTQIQRERNKKKETRIEGTLAVSHKNNKEARPYHLRGGGVGRGAGLAVSLIREEF